MTKESLLVVGAGMAAARLVRELRDIAPDRYDITLVGAEPRAAYNRVLLSSLLADEISERDIELAPASWWRDSGVTLISGRTIAALDLAARAVRFEHGATRPFDRLVLATGSDAIRLPLPGADLPGVMTFRTIDDVGAMRRAASRGARAIVIGGGLLGLEAAHGLAKAGAATCLIHVMDRLMERQLDPAAALLLKHEVERRGIDVRLASQTVRIAGTRRATGIVLADGDRIDADLVVMAVGVRPNVALAKSAGIATARGILVDDGLATNVAGIYAIGECVEHCGAVYGLVEPAYEQARVLARRLAGGDDLYGGSLVSTNLKVSGVNVFSAGDFLGTADSESLVLRDRGLGIYKKLVLRASAAGPFLAGCVLYGDIADGLWYLDLIRSGRPIGAMRCDLMFGCALAECEAA